MELMCAALTRAISAGVIPSCGSELRPAHERGLGDMQRAGEEGVKSLPCGQWARGSVSHGAAPPPRVVFALSQSHSSPLLGSAELTTSMSLFSQEEDDWKEFEQKEEVDYSGLRVQSMQIRYYLFFLSLSSVSTSSFSTLLPLD